jgi:hypothetical protein
VVFSVQSVKDLAAVVIPHFDRFPLISQKRADYELLKQAVEIMIGKQHLNPSGLQKVVNIRASMNKGITTKLKDSFLNIKPVARPLVDLITVPNPQ